jgi:uncharacterized protein YecE (DUF72 family)
VRPGTSRSRTRRSAFRAPRPWRCPGREAIAIRTYVGTSGWQYRDWRGTFYPERLPQREWLPYFASRFETVEVNNSFYRLPERSTFERWRDQTPPGFVVTVKASRFLTHLKRLKDPEDPLALFWERATGLRERLGPVLFQLPPRFRVDVERLRRFLGALPDGIRPAFEFRDGSWLTDEVFGMLDGAGAALVWPDRFGEGAELPVVAGWVYVRFHQGTSEGPDYRRGALETWASRIAAAGVSEAYVYFNNDPTGAAIRDARTMIELLGKRGVAA